MANNHDLLTLWEMPSDEGSNLTQNSHPLKAAFFQCLVDKGRLGETEHRPCSLALIWDNSERSVLLQSSL